VVYEGVGVVGRGRWCVVVLFFISTLLTPFRRGRSNPLFASLPFSSAFVFLRARATHVALSATQETASFGLSFLSFGVAQAASFAPIRVLRSLTCRDRVDVHCVGIPFGWPIRWLSRWIAASVLSGREEVAASWSQARKYEAPSLDLSARRRLPVVEALRHQVPLKNGIVDPFSKSLLKHL
jgi:hypothetical protein